MQEKSVIFSSNDMSLRVNFCDMPNNNTYYIIAAVGFLQCATNFSWIAHSNNLIGKSLSLYTKTAWVTQQLLASCY